MKSASKPKKKKSAVQMSRLTARNLDERLRLLVRSTEAAARQAEADRDRLARLENATDADRRKSERHRRRIARAMEDAFAASLPRVMKAAHGIVLRAKNIRMRARKNNHSREFDFIAPNGKITLAGEVKNHLTRRDVAAFSDALTNDFRESFPEYADKPVYGVVAGGVIDEDAARLACRRGFYILRLEGAEIHPDTAKDFRPKAY